jgi:hypothetical protein
MGEDEPTTDTQFRARIDLWMHCDDLLWSRLKQLYLIQAGYFALTAYLLQREHPSDSKYIMWIALAFIVPLHMVLIMLALNERGDREAQGNALWDNYGFNITTYSVRNPRQRVVLFLRACIVAGIFIIGLAVDFVIALYVTEPSLFKLGH